MSGSGNPDNVAIQKKNDLVMMGIKVDLAIVTRRVPNFIHTKWNISHADPEFDLTGRNNSISSDIPPGCGKADILQQMWTSNLDFQMQSYTSNVGLVTMQV